MQSHPSKTNVFIAIAVKLLLIAQFVMAREACSLYGRSSGSKSGQGAKIVGGQNAIEKELPYQLLMISRQSARERGLCGAILINATHALTAAHCTHGHDASIITLNGGVINRGNLDNAGEGPNAQARQVSKIIEHPRYENRLEASYIPNRCARNDIALLEVSQPFEINDYVRPIKLATKNMVLPGSGTISGWGCMSKDIQGECKTNQYVQIAQVLQKATVSISTDKDCAGPLQPAGIKIFTYQICVGDDGRGACAGDSGGPFAIEQGGEKILVGIASFATFDCACAGWPAVYTEVSYFLPWINYGVDDTEEQIVGGSGGSGLSQNYVILAISGASLFIVQMGKTYSKY